MGEQSWLAGQPSVRRPRRPCCEPRHTAIGELPAYEAEYEPSPAPPALLHCDLKPEHVLYDPVARRITGVLDWGDVSLGDPDFDLAIIGIFFGDALLARLLDHLPDRDPETVLDKARFFTTLRALQDLAYDVELSAAAREPR